MQAWIMLYAAIACEVAATLSLRLTDGFTRPLPVAAVLFGYGLSFFLISRTLDQIPVSTAYAIWSGLGTAVVAGVGMTMLGEPASAGRMLFIGVIVAGVVGLNVVGGGSSA